VQVVERASERASQLASRQGASQQVECASERHEWLSGWDGMGGHDTNLVLESETRPQTRSVDQHLGEVHCRLLELCRLFAFLLLELADALQSE
jgi:hypothetical protein